MRRFALPAVVAALLLIAGCDEAADTGAGSGGGGGQPPPTVTVANPLVDKIIDWDEFTGRFEATEDVIVRARVTGYVQEIHFTDGQTVERGQLLFTIDPRTYEADVAAARAELTSAEASRRLASEELNRLEQLTAGRTVTQSQLDQARRERDAAAASVEAARAALARAQLDVEFTEVRSPISGRISDARVDVGDLVIGDANPTELTRVVAIDPVHFTFELSERDFLGYQRSRVTGEMANARENTVVVEVQLSDEKGWGRTGAIDFVDNVVDDGTGAIRLRAVIPNDERVITPGLFGRLRLPGSPEYEAILLPDSVILSDQARKIVYVLDENDTVQPRIVRLGPRDSGMRVIREGLKPDDRVVISGLMKVRPGVTVTPQEGEVTRPQNTAAAQ